MSDFGLFEASVVEDTAPAVQARVASKRLNAAIYDVRAHYGQFLLGASGLDEFEDRWHYSKRDIRATVEPHLMPVTGVMRRIHDALKRECKEAIRKGAPFADYKNFAECEAKNSDKSHPDAYCGEIKHRTEDKKGRRQADKTGPVQDIRETDHRAEGDLIPRDNFDGYLDAVDQGGPEKVQRDFGSRSGEDDWENTRQARIALDVYTDWAHSNGLRVASLNTLQLYGANCSDGEFRVIDAAIRRTAEEDDEEREDEDRDREDEDREEEDEDREREDEDEDRDEEDDEDEDEEQGDEDEEDDDDDRERDEDDADDDGPPWLTGSRRHHADVTQDPDPEDDEESYGQPPAPAPAGPPQAAPAAPPGAPPAAAGPAPVENQPAEDHLLDTASQAVGQMIDQETQEFQQIIDPLTQALQAIEYAQQVEQAENPIDVTPPQGTVDVGPKAAAPQQQMAYRIARHYGMTKQGYTMLLTAMSRRHYDTVADAIAGLPPEHRPGIAASLGDMFKADNPRFAHGPFFADAGVDPRYASRRQAGEWGLPEIFNRDRDYAGDLSHPYSPEEAQHGYLRDLMEEPPPGYPGRPRSRFEEPPHDEWDRYSRRSRGRLDFRQGGNPRDRAGDAWAEGRDRGDREHMRQDLADRDYDDDPFEGSRAYQNWQEAPHSFGRSVEQNDAYFGEPPQPYNAQTDFDSMNRWGSKSRQAMGADDMWDAYRAGDFEPAGTPRGPGIGPVDDEEDDNEPAFRPGHEPDYAQQGADWDRYQRQERNNRDWQDAYHADQSGGRHHIDDIYQRGRSDVPFVNVDTGDNNAIWRNAPGPIDSEHYDPSADPNFVPPERIGSRGRRDFNGGRQAAAPLTPELTLDSFEFPGANTTPHIKDNLTITPDTFGAPTSLSDIKPTKKSRRDRHGVSGQGLYNQVVQQRSQQGLVTDPEPTAEAFKEMAPTKGVSPNAINRVVQKVAPSVAVPKVKAKKAGFGGSFFTRRVPGWTWNDHLAAYTAKSAEPFTCHCGSRFDTPGYYNCRCGKVFNSYVIGSGGDDRTASIDMFLCREVPVRPDMIMASRRTACDHEDCDGDCGFEVGRDERTVEGLTHPEDVEWVTDEDREDADAPHAPYKNAGIYDDLPVGRPVGGLEGLRQNMDWFTRNGGQDFDEFRRSYGHEHTPQELEVAKDMFGRRRAAIGEDDHSVVYRDGERYCSKCHALLWDPNVHHCPAKQATRAMFGEMRSPDDRGDEPTVPPKNDHDKASTLPKGVERRVKEHEGTDPDRVDEHVSGGNVHKDKRKSHESARMMFGDWTKYDDDLDRGGPSKPPSTTVKPPPDDWAHRDEHHRWVGPAIPRRS